MLRRAAIATIFLILVLPGAGILWTARDLPHLGQSYDDGIYWVTAKALASGAGYRYIFLPDEPHAVKYPPLYPLYLSLAWRAQPNFPRNIPVAVLLQGALLLIQVGLLIPLFRQLSLSWRRTLLLTGLVVTSTQFLTLTCSLMSEMLFDCFLFAAVLVAERSVVSERGRWPALLAGILTGAAYLTRSAAAPMFVAVPVYYAIRRRPGLSLFFLAGALPGAAGWQFWVYSHSAENLSSDASNYLAEYLRFVSVNGFWSSLSEHLVNMFTTSADIFVVNNSTLLRSAPVQPLFLIAAISGAMRLARRRQWPLYMIFSGLYTAMIMCWWFNGITRLLLPVYPALMAGIAEEASHFATLVELTIKRRLGASLASAWWVAAPRLAIVTLVVILVAHNYADSRRMLQDIMAKERDDQEFDTHAYTWITRHADPNTVLLTWRDSLAFLHTGVPSSRSFLIGTIRIGGPMLTAAPLSQLPVRYRRALILLTKSEVSGSDRGTVYRDLRSRVESVAGTHLKYETSGAVIYALTFR